MSSASPSPFSDSESGTLYSLPLDDARATLIRVGGKGANLSLMKRHGLPVPDGFLITTDAYWYFLEHNKLGSWIEERLVDSQLDNPSALELLSASIRSQFDQGEMPGALRQALLAAHRQLEDRPVAVRSSATAEDLPDLSFAGQQDTFLNVLGETQFMRAVVACWSSLWTARAIGYRTRNEIAHQDVALAVVVQELIRSEISGVLFTANPLTGNRREMAIDATLGLGEALVSGQVEPDHYVVDATSGTVRHQEVGAKATVIQPSPGGGTEKMAGIAADGLVLTDSQISSLVALGQQLQQLFGTPQDVEWTWAEGKLWLLQSRPITSLFPLPESLPLDDPLRVMISFAAIQGVMDPITPLGQDVLQGFFAGGGALFGMASTIEQQRALISAGGYLFVNVTPTMRTSWARPLMQRALPLIEPAAAQALSGLLEEPELAPGGLKPSWRMVGRLLRLFGRMLGQMLRVMARPAQHRERLQRALDQQVELYHGLFADATDFPAFLLIVRRFIETLAPNFIPSLLPVVAAGIGSLQQLRIQTESLNDAPDALQVTGGLPHNVTTEMDLALWHTAQQIQADEATVVLFSNKQAANLADRFLAGQLPPVAQRTVTAFMDKYGMRGVGEIDVGRRRWRENPTPIMRTLQSYLQIKDPNRAPDAVFARSAHRAEETIEVLVQSARASRGGVVRARLVAFLASRVRALAGLRESPKFFVIRVLGLLRQELLRYADGLVRTGVLQEADDLFFLRLSELERLAQGQAKAWKELVLERRKAYLQAARRARIPRVLLSDGRAFYEGLKDTAAAEDTLLGNPVSPGVVVGQVRVVADPHQAELKPGEILVCQGTDPAWTPLFLSAAGLVMEVGGMMTHGSVVAREYGIPAVVGVHLATSRLMTGQWVQVDGSTGRVHCLPGADVENPAAADLAIEGEAPTTASPIKSADAYSTGT